MAMKFGFAERFEGWLLRGLIRWLMRRAGAPPLEVALWDGRLAYSPAGPSVGRIVVLDRKLVWRLPFADPTLLVGDALTDGRMVVEGDRQKTMGSFLKAFDEARSSRFRRRRREGERNRRAADRISRSRDDIRRHYDDMGSDFYRLWLDERLLYTCAYFRDPGMTVEQAQEAKIEHVARKLRLEPGMEVADVGCGWGGGALYMARHHGVRVRGYSNSPEHVAYARKCAEREGLERLAEFVEDDWQNVEGEYDALYSLGMLEHVGLANYPVLGETIERVLKPGGLGLIQSIGLKRPAPMNKWLERRIFPGGKIAALREMMAVFETCNFSVLDVENLRPHYVLTLREWLARLESAEETVTDTWGELLFRRYRLYLELSIQAFEDDFAQLFQIVFARAGNRDVPRTRDSIYVERAVTE